MIGAVCFVVAILMKWQGPTGLARAAKLMRTAICSLSETDWTMALYPGVIARGAVADPTKIMKLESVFDPKAGPAEHMLIDITPGHGKFEGKAVLTLHFGGLFLSGLLG